MSERLPWCSPEVYDQGTREEQALLIVYAVERDAEDWRKLQAVVSSVAVMVFGTGKADGDG